MRTVNWRIFSSLIKSSLGTFAFLGMVLGGVSSLFAQPEEPPRSSEAAVLEKKVAEEAREKLKEKQRKPEIEKVEEEKKPLPEAEQKFFVRKITLRGNHSIGTETFTPFITPYEGRDLTLTEANELARKIEKEYRSRGFITTLAYVPPQKMVEGELVLEVFEGKMGELHVEGNRWFSEKPIRRYWPLKKGGVVLYPEMEKSLRKMNENPDREIRAVLRPGSETGTTDVYLKVKDTFPLHAGMQYDNQGVRSTGRRRFGFTLRHTNALIPDSTALMGTVFGKDFAALFTQYLIPLTPLETKLIYGFSASRVSPKREFKGSDIAGSSSTHSVTLRQPLWRGESFWTHFHVGFDFKDTRTKDVTGTRRRDRLRVLRSGLELQRRDRFGATFASLEASFGIKGLGASGENNPLAGRLGAEPDFVKGNALLSRSLELPLGTSAQLSLQAQLSPSKMTPQEELYLGGAGSVRGYPEGDYLADQGLLFTFEYLFPFFVIPEKFHLPGSKLPLKKEIQGVFFFDQGYGRLRGPSSDEVHSRHLIGIGGGVRIRLRQNLFARLELGHALGNEPLSESDHTRFHFRLQFEY